MRTSKTNPFPVLLVDILLYLYSFLFHFYCLFIVHMICYYCSYSGDVRSIYAEFLLSLKVFCENGIFLNKRDIFKEMI